jgi:hypothetical protein
MPKTNVYKIELMIVDFDRIGEDEIRLVLEEAHYPNRCISPNVVSIESREVDWTDEHPLNKRSTWKAFFAGLFSSSTEPKQ